MNQKTIQELFGFKGKTVIVTGGAMGIGYGIARRFAEAGARIALVDMNAEVGQKKAKRLVEEYHTDVLFQKVDVSNENDVEEMVRVVEERFGTIDVLVNNAGIFPSKPILEMELALWEKIQAVNMRSVFLMCRSAAKVMVKQGGGTIVNIASIDALHPSMVGLAAYDASKHGVWGFTKNFALEVAQYKIRVNAIAPGGIATEGVAEMNKGVPNMEEVMRQFTAKIPLGRFGEPDDIATAALFLASDAARYMTGSLIVVDGGFLLM